MRIVAALLLASLPGVAGADDLRVSVAATILSHCLVDMPAPSTAVLLRCNGAVEPLRARIAVGGDVATLMGTPLARVTRNHDVVVIEF